MKHIIILLAIMLMGNIAVSQNTNNGMSDVKTMIKELDSLSANGGRRKDIMKRLDKIDKCATLLNANIHSAGGNVLDTLVCSYDSIPYLGTILIETSDSSFTRYVNHGMVSLPTISDSIIVVHFVDFVPHATFPRYAKKKLDGLRVNSTRTIRNPRYDNNQLFFNTTDSLYWSAIKSNQIPGFAMSSSNAVLNLAVCIEVICRANGQKMTIDQILREMLSSSLSDTYVKDLYIAYSTDNCSVAISEHEPTPDLIVNQLMQKRFIIGMDYDGNPFLLTAIAFTNSDNELTIKKVRMRTPNHCLGPRIEVEWDEFVKKYNKILLVDIKTLLN